MIFVVLNIIAYCFMAQIAYIGIMIAVELVNLLKDTIEFILTNLLYNPLVWGCKFFFDLFKSRDVSL